MNTPEAQLDEAVESLSEILPQVWDRIRSNFRSAGMSKFGITIEQFHTLRHIYRGYHYAGALAEERQISCAAVSQAIHARVVKRLVTQKQGDGDHRQVRLELTPYARQVLDGNARENRIFIRQKLTNIDA